MTIRTAATIWHAEGVRFDDVQALDEDLMAHGGEGLLADLYRDRAEALPGWNGPFVIDADGELLIADADSAGSVRYGSTTDVGVAWHRGVTETIARHLVAGELVFEIMEEGQPAEYLVIMPGAFDVRDEYPG